MSPLSVKYTGNQITCHQQELQNIIYFPYGTMSSSVDMAVEYNNLLKRL